METFNEKENLLDVIQQTLLPQRPVQIRRSWRKKHDIFLFSGVLVVSNNVYKKKFRIKHIIPLHYVRLYDCVRTEHNASSVSIFLFWPMLKYDVTFSSPEQKKWWCFLLQRYIDEAKKRVENKNSALQIITEDTGNCTSACACAWIATLILPDCDQAWVMIPSSQIPPDWPPYTFRDTLGF
ncbi:rho GTPase-activating protein 20-like [Psammomys obesus]|uniref:rho GTPase-activating protein 20-like n=1 Tax=Psammomys obesus TaxID=48139 RepID=UPI002452B3F6|nr:rho GTPase-activating protein 20-like [Psammomys obesus]